MEEEKEYGMVVFGGTGFTGERVVKYLAQHDNLPISAFPLAVAGRNVEALEKVLKKYEAEEMFSVIQADVEKPETIQAMCSKARVLINCVGPFQRFGEIVVKSCIEAGTDYVDITGEPLFIDSMILKYHEQAKENKCVIIPSAGFDSVPSDLGVLYATNQFESPARCASVESYLYVKPGSKGIAGNFGTYDSLIDGYRNAGRLAKVRKELNRPPLKTVGPKLKKQEGYRYIPSMGKYSLPFPGSDATVVRNSQFYLQQNPGSEEKRFPVNYAAYFTFKSFSSIIYLGIFQTLLSFFIRFKWGVSLLKKFPRFFTFGLVSKTGPTEEQIDGCSFTTTFISKGFSNYDDSSIQVPDLEVVTAVSGPEPGYVSTPICVCEAAASILEHKPSDLLPFGVLSPASALHNTDYISRLNSKGVVFSLVSKKKI